MPSAGQFIPISKRLQQVLKNLLSNAFKFTDDGTVKLKIASAEGGWSASHQHLEAAPEVIAFEVSDTGIGIAPEKQKIIFEAFQQADASTSRKYGGTGLGLAISRELAALLGGEIQLRSTFGAGSVFTLYLPARYAGPAETSRQHESKRLEHPQALVRLADHSEKFLDDRDMIGAGDSVLLIVEDDPHYARILIDLAHDFGWKVLFAMRGVDAI